LPAASTSKASSGFNFMNVSLDFRKGHEVQAQDAFRELLRPEFRERFQVLHWEDLCTHSEFERQ
jgi:hypothetical protein